MTTHSPHKIQIAPSMLASDLTKLGEEVHALEKAGADVLHFDIMDGHFVPNLTFGLPVLESLRSITKLPLDAHLMITNADRYIDDFAKVGCNWISVHIEVCPHINRSLNHIRKLGLKAGIAINPGTSLSTLDAVIDDANYILVMSVNPGFGGQKFIASSYERVRELKARIGNRKIQIQIDGGIKKHNIGAAVSAGAEIIVIGTGLFSLKDYTTAISTLRHACEISA